MRGAEEMTVLRGRILELPPMDLLATCFEVLGVAGLRLAGAEVPVGLLGAEGATAGVETEGAEGSVEAGRS